MESRVFGVNCNIRVKCKVTTFTENTFLLVEHT